MASEAGRVQAVGELGVTLRGAPDSSALIGAAYALDGVLLRESDLSPEFLNLRTGLLGELFQKCVNYRLAVAFVLPDFTAHGERFAELAYEHARHPCIRFVHTEEEAWAWLGRQVR
ncbi:DUF4180 domain-containing protein [Deinococcus multiflagellatus]|uniref:DUF4180 domain-containing protein n=1 Tax=Deinococcus multiflagellatus TaxID=1656887 RepID=A0ABW1ZFS1_9DEIO|nr:DUF4180 domain-containing protein [Deinococcus multiflagellatus]MBZ9712948.1 DUF4180 domain-containing protein [Deinococcus multiflagellatus]